MPGAGRNPWPACNKKSRRQVPQVQPNHPAFPAQWLYGLYRALLGDRAFLPPSPARSSFRKLSLSVGRPGPRDFAVRFGAVRPHDNRARRQRVHRILTRVS